MDLFHDILHLLWHRFVKSLFDKLFHHYLQTVAAPAIEKLGGGRTPFLPTGNAAHMQLNINPFTPGRAIWPNSIH